MKKLYLYIIVAITIASCESNSPSSNKIITSDASSDSLPTVTNLEDSAPPKNMDTSRIKKIEPPSTTPNHSENNTTNRTIPNTTTGDYAWLSNYNSNHTLQQQIPVPEGYQRVVAKKGSFGAWLRGLPLQPTGSKVLLCDGSEKPYQLGAYRLIDIDVGKRDLQQCADAVMRLKAEYHYSKKNYEAIHFNYTSGHTIRFSDWSQGKKPKFKNKKVYFTSPSGSSNTSYKNFKKYLINVYCYAGTASLSKELKAKKIADIQPGDVFIWGGFPGHAILVIDVAEQQQTGKKIFLLAQSYMPAQSIHILKNFNEENLSPWYQEDFGNELYTPEWTFERNALKTW